MRFSQIIAPAALLATAVAHKTPGTTEHVVLTTVVITDYTTYCPLPTTFTHKNVTYTAAIPTTLIITNCPCTFTYSNPPPSITLPGITHPPPPPPSYNVTAKSSSSIVTVITEKPKPKPTKEVPPLPSSEVPPPGETTAAPPPPGVITGATPVVSTTTTTGAGVVSTAAADKNAAGLGALVIAGFAALMF